MNNWSEEKQEQRTLDEWVKGEDDGERKRTLPSM